jgi:type III restriction enzyme
VSIELLPFQTKASQQIVARYGLLVTDKKRPIEYMGWPTPFYQALASLTGSGKTAILADTVSLLRAGMQLEPIVLWISKSKAVVDQTFANFEAGGKYEHLIPQLTTGYLSEAKVDQIQDDTQACILLATVGSFNQKSKGDGKLKVHQKDEDENDGALWEILAERKAPSASERRPLIIVYDEAHNLSDQQTDLLLELEPDIILAASATMRTPGKLGQIIDRLKQVGWNAEAISDPEDSPSRCLITAIRSKEPVDAGLVKRQIVLGGYDTEMETTLNDMIEDFQLATLKADELEAGFLPKAIYVCRTNISQDDGTADNPHRPFNQRKAPPILIWRYLTEEKGIPADEIALYCDLKMNQKDYPAPEGFTLFSGGEDDFAVFSQGTYRHIIFNQSLQEGWDDPACCFAYIDKSMGSALQVEQVIGRVLRQPGARHYPDPLLNTANFYIRIDSKQEFPKILEVVRRKIASEMPDVKLEGFSDARDRRRSRIEPKQSLTIPEIHIDADESVDPLTKAISSIHDYTTDSVNVQGAGELTRAIQQIGDGSKPSIETHVKDHSNRVIARWLVRRHMQSRYPEAVKTIDWADPKFEARVEITSVAAQQLREDAERLVDTYLSHAELAFEDSNPYTVGAVYVRPDATHKFNNSVHESYSDLNTPELAVAHEIDGTGHTWVRNPVNGGYSIPLLDKGESRRFFPDFLVWKDKKIIAIDPKGGFLLQTEAGRKLLAIRDENGQQRILVRFITDGTWSAETMKQTSSSGFSIWRMTTTGQIRCTTHADVASAVKKALETK